MKKRGQAAFSKKGGQATFSAKRSGKAVFLAFLLGFWGNVACPLFLLLSSNALADWYDVTIPDTALEVNILDVDAGNFAVAGANGAYEIRNRSVVGSLPATGLVVDATLDATHCFEVTTSAPPKHLRGGCGADTQLSSTDVIQRARRAENGAGYALGEELGIRWYWFSTSPDADFVRTGQLGSTLAATALSAISFGANTFGILYRSVNQIQIFKDGVGVRSFTAVVPPRELNAYGTATSLFALSASDGNSSFPAGGLFRIDLQDGGTSPLQLPQGSGTVHGAFVEQNTGDALTGDGFGMATTSSGLLQPVPDPSAIGQQWVHHRASNAPNPQGTVVCRKGRLCVALDTGGNAGTLHVYENRHAPVFQAVAPSPVEPGNSVTLDLAPKDEDGDPLFVTTQFPNFPQGVVATEDGGVVTISMAAGQCGEAVDAGFVVTASDGVTAVDQAVPLTLRAKPLSNPQIGTNGQTATCAGTKLHFVELANRSCSNAQFQWTPAGGLPLVEGQQQGAEVTYTPVENKLESIVGKSVLMDVQVTTPNQTVSAQQSVQIVPNPFVTARFESRQPVVQESSLLAVTVELQNQAGCSVGGIEWVDLSADLDLIPSTVQVNGSAAAVFGNSISGLTLASDAPLRITYTLRPRLLGHPVLRGEARLNGVAISATQNDSAPQSSGCSCNQSSAGGLVPLLGLLVWAGSRRAHPRATVRRR